MAIKARLGVYGIIAVLGRLELQDLSTADAKQLFSALVECGDRESNILNKLSALANANAEELGKLLQLCVKHAHGNGVQLICEQPAADEIDADAILCLCRDILDTGMFGRGDQGFYTALESVLTLAGAELIEPSDAAVLFTGSLQIGDVMLAAELTELLPQLQDHPSSATAVASSERLLQLLRTALLRDCPDAVAILCSQAVMSQIDAQSRAAVLVATMEAAEAGARCVYVKEQPQHVEGVLAQLLPQVLCTRDVALQLLQACAVHACPQLLQELMSYSSVQELTADDMEPLLLQCISNRKQRQVARRVASFELLLQLPASQSLSAGALSRLLTTVGAGRWTLFLQLLRLPVVQLLPPEAVVAVATAYLQGRQGMHQKPDQVPAEHQVIMQLPGYLQLCGPQVEGLLQVAFQGGHSSWVERLLKHPAAPVGLPLMQLCRASSR